MVHCEKARNMKLESRVTLRPCIYNYNSNKGIIWNKKQSDRAAMKDFSILTPHYSIAMSCHNRCEPNRGAGVKESGNSDEPLHFVQILCAREPSCNSSGPIFWRLSRRTMPSLTITVFFDRHNYRSNVCTNVLPFAVLVKNKFIYIW